MALLAGIFSSAKIYILVGFLLVAAAGITYVEHLRYEAAAAAASLASTQATVSVQNAALATSQATIASLRQENADAQAALVQFEGTQQSLDNTVANAKEAISHVAVPKTCQGLDPRDIVTLDGVRGIFGEPAASDSDAGGKGSAAGGAP
jgi:septal ring factor EnvC (AmiA/AmiB activator)